MLSLIAADCETRRSCKLYTIASQRGWLYRDRSYGLQDKIATSNSIYSIMQLTLMEWHVLSKKRAHVVIMKSCLEAVRGRSLRANCPACAHGQPIYYSRHSWNHLSDDSVSSYTTSSVCCMSFMGSSYIQVVVLTSCASKLEQSPLQQATNVTPTQITTTHACTSAAAALHDDLWNQTKQQSVGFTHVHQST